MIDGEKVFIRYEPLIGTDIEEAAVVLLAKLLQRPNYNWIDGIEMDFNGVFISRERKDIKQPFSKMIEEIVTEYHKEKK